MTSLPSFDEFFNALWKYDPFPWQRMLATRIADGSWPSALDLPTASGKTACMDAAIWALAQQADRPVPQRSAPRRVWFVVDRRIVVDEAHDRAIRIATMLKDATSGPLKTVADRLLQVSGTTRPLGVARLRGGILRDDGWARLPSQPAVITSTVDQLGSRLLFRGYGRRHLTASIFAGLAAHDSLILLDEAHCSVPFLQTLRAVQRFRGERWAEQPIKTPFAFAILSATPPPDIPEHAVFPGNEREQALDHPVLHKRVRASKPAEMVVLNTRRSSAVDPLVVEAATRAQSFVEDEEGKLRVAVIVNRVRTAMHVARTLGEQLAGSADTVLLTGRLRPYERDRLVEQWKPFLKANKPQVPARPVVLVSTQCIEVGADFSFDALVTEAASLDALRQRFGRLNRMGGVDSSPAAVLIREEDTRGDSKDPIYGAAIAETWRMLDEKGTASVREKPAKIIDFGIAALDALLADVEDLTPCLAPTPDAPTLLPAHLDLLCQTAPVPRPEPDIQLFLHGVDRGAPEARVVWRSDLRADATRTWKEAVALCPPASGEALSVPLFRLRQWLAESVAKADLGDVEGAAPPEDDGGEEIRPVLVWAGRERSHLVRQSSALRPNDLVVVPVAYGMVPIGQSEPREALGRDQLDLWEVARVASGRPAALRLHRAVLDPWLDCPPLKELVALAAEPVWEREALEDAIETVLAYQPAVEEDAAGPPGWLGELLREARSGRIERHPEGGLVLFARRSSARRDVEPDLFADDDDLLSASGQEVSLTVHTESVKRAVQKIASRCIEDGFLEPLLTAACWHDVGKLDERFQVLLRQGNELAAVAGEPLAKSKEIPASPARRRSIREASGLPQDFRHEMLSLQLAERCAPIQERKDLADLVLHLVASHHGHARPFAPISPDPSPPGIAGSHGGRRLELSADDRCGLCPPHAAASGTAERFWRLTRRYGWWGLAYLEAMLRLGDWYGTERVVDGVREEPASGWMPPPEPVADAVSPGPIVLSGIDGANPLGFLAAVGTLAVLHTAGEGEARLHWKRSATWQPVISGISASGFVVAVKKREEIDIETAVARVLADALRGNAVQKDAERERREAQERYDAAKRAVNDKRKEIKDRGLRGKERKAAVEAEVAPLKLCVDRCRHDWQTALRKAVPRPELAIGKHIDCSVEEYREHVDGFLREANASDRDPLDFLAAFASDACLHKSDVKRKDGIVAATPFCFVTGSGKQWFLDSVRQLVTRVDEARLHHVLFEPWRQTDSGLSLRWDPAEDRRHALMDRDPTASGNEPRTVWMANLLAYRGLLLFPSVPRRGKLATTAWSEAGDEPTFTWPIWNVAADPSTVRSLVLLPELTGRKPKRTALRARGIVAAFRARRIKVGSRKNYKVNFSPARGV